VVEKPEYGDVGSRLLFENDRIKIWEMRLAPGERSPLHRHDHDYVMIQLEGDKVAAEFEPESGGTWGGETYIEGPVTDGTVVWADAGGIETAINIGDETFREIIVELKS
jgi:quercetin dioxygenase-like cupin family protein